MHPLPWTFQSCMLITASAKTGKIGCFAAASACDFSHPVCLAASCSSRAGVCFTSKPACSDILLCCRFVFDFEHCTQYFATLEDFMGAFNTSSMKICSTQLWIQPGYVSTVSADYMSCSAYLTCFRQTCSTAPHHPLQPGLALLYKFMRPILTLQPSPLVHLHQQHSLTILVQLRDRSLLAHDQ